MNTAVASITRRTQGRSNAESRLRALLSDGEWHSAPELASTGGMRFGARLQVLHEDSKHPVHHKWAYVNGGPLTTYRQVSKAECPLCKEKA